MERPANRRAVKVEDLDAVAAEKSARAENGDEAVFSFGDVEYEGNGTPVTIDKDVVKAVARAIEQGDAAVDTFSIPDDGDAMAAVEKLVADPPERSASND